MVFPLTMAAGKIKPDDLDFIQNAVNQLETATQHGVDIGNGKLLKVSYTLQVWALNQSVD